jgi:hypothetical protein
MHVLFPLKQIKLFCRKSVPETLENSSPSELAVAFYVAVSGCITLSRPSQRILKRRNNHFYCIANQVK